MNTSVEKDVTGGCVCGAVRYHVKGPMRQVIVCHCRQCQRYSGSQVSASQAYMEDFELLEQRGLKWFQSSDFASRGFCQECGSNLFYKLDDADRVSIWAGSLDDISGLKVVEHIFVEEKGDYYDIDNNLPSQPRAGFSQRWALPDKL